MIAAVGRAGAELVGLDEIGLAMASLDADARDALRPLLADLADRTVKLRDELHAADRERDEVLRARAELRAEAEARRTARSGTMRGR